MSFQSTISVYSFEDADGNEIGTFTTMNYTEACDYAKAACARVRDNEYEYADSTIVADYTDHPGFRVGVRVHARTGNYDIVGTIKAYGSASDQYLIVDIDDSPDHDIEMAWVDAGTVEGAP